MIFDVKNTFGKGKKATVYDAQGTAIPSAFKYNTKTREVSMYLTGKNSTVSTKKILMKSVKPRLGLSLAWEVLKVTVKIPGSWIIVDGKKY